MISVCSDQGLSGAGALVQLPMPVPVPEPFLLHSLAVVAAMFPTSARHTWDSGRGLQSRQGQKLLLRKICIYVLPSQSRTVHS